MPDGTDRALTWTNRHPNQASRAGVVLFRHSSEVLSGDEARRLIAAGARIETTHVERVRGALGFCDDETGIFRLEDKMDVEQLRNERSQMEERIRDFVTKEFSVFRSRTGFSPSSISVDLGRLDRIGQKEAEFVVTSVRVEIPL